MIFTILSSVIIIMALRNQWREGPIESIICSPAHGQPVFSLAVGKNSFVTGSADHGLREYSFESGKHLRQLYAKKYGHKEWVSTCSYTPSGRIISGAMDSVVCFWDSKAVRCDHFLGHQGSISKVLADDHIGISASYDATIILWDLAKKEASQKLIGPHKEAIMDFQWSNSLLVSGDKSGVVAIWDLNKSKMIKAVRTHKGSISNIKLHHKAGLISTAGLNDGSIASFDMRSNCPIYRQSIHKGSVNCIKVIQDKNLLISCSASGSIIVQSVPDFKQVLNINANDMVFYVQQAFETIIAGTAKGNVIGYDLFSGEVLYGYGTMKKGGCRLLGLNNDKTRLVCAGQDQSATLLLYK